MLEGRHRIIDLHSHTNHSDGFLSPSQLVERAHQMNVDVLAITDHDSISALETAQQFIQSKQLPLHLINGIEMSTYWNNHEIHIVGLAIDTHSESLLSLIEQQKMHRIERAQEIGQKLEQLGITQAFTETEKQTDGGVITRAHFARYLVKTGKVKNINAAFSQYLSKNKPAYVSPKWCSLEHAIETIHDSGGLAILAHPNRYDLSNKWLKRLVDAFKLATGDGIEIGLPQIAIPIQKKLSKLAIDYQLFASAGSDFHEPCCYRELGKGIQLPENITPIWQHKLLQKIIG